MLPLANSSSVKRTSTQVIAVVIMLPPNLFKETIDSTFCRLLSVGPWLLYLRCTKGAFWSMVDTCDYRDGWSEGACSMAPLLTTAKGTLWLMLGDYVGPSGGISGTGWLLESLGTSPWCLFFRAVRSATILVSCLICSFRSSITSGNSVWFFEDVSSVTLNGCRFSCFSFLNVDTLLF